MINNLHSAEAPTTELHFVELVKPARGLRRR